MSSSTLRVELRGNPSAAVYEVLHARLAAIGCKRFIIGTDQEDVQRTYPMPHAEYDLETTATFENVRDAVQSTAQRVWEDAEVLVTEAVNRAWYMAPVAAAG